MKAAAALEIIIYLPSQSLRTARSARAIFHQNVSQHAIHVYMYSYNHTTMHIASHTLRSVVCVYVRFNLNARIV